MSKPAICSRRQMLQVLLGTAPALALLEPTIASLWPADELQRETHAPLDFALVGGLFLMEANFSYDDVWGQLPTAREYYWSTGELEELSGWEQDRAILDAFGYDDHPLPDDPDLDPECRESIAESLEALRMCREQLDEPIGWERLSDYQAARYLPQSAGVFLYESISEPDKLGLDLVEGLDPGSPFVCVHYRGDLDELNRRLAQGGYNAVVRRG